jgi:hypothetical protein
LNSLRPLSCVFTPKFAEFRGVKELGKLKPQADMGKCEVCRGSAATVGLFATIRDYKLSEFYGPELGQAPPATYHIFRRGRIVPNSPIHSWLNNAPSNAVTKHLRFPKEQD